MSRELNSPAGNPGMDVTAEVIKGLDGAVTQMSFDVPKHD
jgi:hypothetical protein